jgi:hypothetical protein
MLEVLEPARLIAELTARHMEGREMLGFDEQQLLAHLSLGYSADETGQLLGYAGGTVRGRCTRLEHRLLDVTLVPPCARYLRTWTDLHLDCCARETKRMIEKARGA